MKLTNKIRAVNTSAPSGPMNKLKGMEMPTGVLVAILLAVIIAVAAIAMLYVLPNLSEEEAYKGYFSTCCASYNLAGHCGEGAGDPTFQCTVAEKFATGGKMSISDLSAHVGAAPEACCMVG
jgi:hypothetical protein